MLAKFKQWQRARTISKGGYSEPELIIVGAQKAGTSALFKILAEHPDFVASIGKELHYFDNDEVYKPNDHTAYHQGFPLKSDTKDKIVFECTPSYLYHPKSAERIAKFKPEAKIIILLREPAARALSAWNMYHNFKNNPTYKGWFDERSFAKAVATELPDAQEEGWYTNKIAYVARGLYLRQIQKYYEYFPADQIMVMEAKELKNNFEQAVTKLSAFLGCNAKAFQFATANVGKKYDHSEHQETLDVLKDFYKPHNEKLFDFLGKRFDW